MVLDKFSLQNKLALITGGAGLLGLQHAQAVLEAGGSVVLADIQEAVLREKCSRLESLHPGRVLAQGMDVTSESSAEECLAGILRNSGKAPDILINNAAIDAKFEKNSAVQKSRLENFGLDQWQKELAVGLTGSFLCAKVFGSAMARKGSGTIINIASDLGIIAPDQRLYQKEGMAPDHQPVKPVTYSVIKHGLIGLTRYLATYWADRGVRANALAPGGVYNDHPEEFVKRISSLIPMGRMAELGEYQAALVFLASDASSYMNGTVLVMDGGRSVW